MVRFVTICLCGLLYACTGNSQVIKGTYAIKNLETGMYLRVKDANADNGTPLVSYSPVKWKCVTWDFQHVDGQTYQLKNLFTNKTFQPCASACNGSALEQQPLTVDQISQEYEFIPVQHNVYMIKLKGTDLYITPSDRDGTVNSKIILSKYDNSTLQWWTLREQNPDI